MATSDQEKIHSKRVEKMGNYTPNEWGRCETSLETSGEDVKTTLETSGEDVKLHSKRVEKMQVPAVFQRVIPSVNPCSGFLYRKSSKLTRKIHSKTSVFCQTSVFSKINFTKILQFISQITNVDCCPVRVWAIFSSRLECVLAYLFSTRFGW